MLLIFAFLAGSLAVLAKETTAERSFIIANDQFVKDGENFRIFSGSIHYSRVHPSYWDDRLSRLRSMGLNTIETYMFWNWHEEVEGQFDFEGGKDIIQFLELAQQNDLLVLLRAGPYGCGEWRFGGIPDWMLQKPGLEIRTNNSVYLEYVDKWWGEVLPLIKSKNMLYADGGPVVMVQMENEFGSYGDTRQPADHAYMEHLVSVARSYLGEEVILYTTDGGSVSYMERGTLNGSVVFTVGDFGAGTDPSGPFSAQKQFNPAGLSPNMDSEYYIDWLTAWGEKMANGSVSSKTSSMQDIFNHNGSLSIYMAHGGTNFGQWNGADGGGSTYNPVITSYDYGAPLDEAGAHGYGSDSNDMYEGVRAVLVAEAKLLNQSLPPAERPPNPRHAYGTVALTSGAHVFGASELCEFQTTLNAPLTMDKWGQPLGMAIYSHALPSTGITPQSVAAFDASDRGYLFVDGVRVGTPTWRPNRPFQRTLNASTDSKQVSLLVEDCGRINYGRDMQPDVKGVLDATFTIDGTNITGNWSVCGMPLSYSAINSVPTSAIPNQSFLDGSRGPTLLRGVLSISSQPVDTWLYTPGFTKGYAWINGFALGRYWPAAGPQQTLYIPAPVMQSGSNDIVLLELETAEQAWSSSEQAPVVSFLDHAIFGSPPSCTQPPSPASGQTLVIYTCDASASSQSWTFSDNHLSPTADPSLCVTAGPSKDPQSGYPAAQLNPCLSPLPANQTFKYDAQNQGIQTPFQNSALDITSHDSFDGARVEVYPFNGGSNQQWKTSANAIITQQDGRCLSLCSFSSN